MRILADSYGGIYTQMDHLNSIAGICINRKEYWDSHLNGNSDDC